MLRITELIPRALRRGKEQIVVAVRVGPHGLRPVGFLPGHDFFAEGPRFIAFRLHAPPEAACRDAEGIQRIGPDSKPDRMLEVIHGILHEVPRVFPVLFPVQRLRQNIRVFPIHLNRVRRGGNTSIFLCSHLHRQGVRSQRQFRGVDHAGKSPGLLRIEEIQHL